MAVAYLEDSTLGGTVGLMKKLVDTLDATRPIVMTDKKTLKGGEQTETTRIELVADQNTRMKGLQELNKIYGVYAPQKRDVNVTVSIQSDAELFAEIDEAERTGKYVDQYKEGERGFELVADPQGTSHGNFETRKRALLQDAPLQEQV